MNLKPMSEIDDLCCGEVVLMPDGYYEAYRAIEEESDRAETADKNKLAETAITFEESPMLDNNDYSQEAA